MPNPTYSSATLSNYNDNAPADDGSAVAANKTKWVTVKDEIGDPLKNFASDMNTNVASAVGAVKQYLTRTLAKSTAYPVVAADDGAMFLVSGDTTITLPAVATAGDGFRLAIKKTDASNTVTIDPNASETIDGDSTSRTMTNQYQTIELVTDASTWHIVGDDDLQSISKLTPTDSNLMVGDGTNWVNESGATLRTSLGLGTGDAVTFTSLMAAAGSVSAPSYAFQGDADTGMYWPGANQLALATAGAAALSIDANGQINLPKQPSFLARTTSSQANVTGDGTAYTVQFPVEVFDQNGDFDGTSTFTAPVTGRYLLAAKVRLIGLTANHTGTNYGSSIVTSNRNYPLGDVNFWTLRDQINNFYDMYQTAIVDMDAADTATVVVNVNATDKTVDIHSHATDARTAFGGCLLQ